MKLPGIDYGGRPESLGRHDINAPARKAAATRQVLDTVSGVAKDIYTDIHQREMERQNSEYLSTQQKTENHVSKFVEENDVYPATMMKAVGADMSSFGEKPEYAGYEAITPYYSAMMTKSHEAALEKVTNQTLRRKLENDWKVNLAEGEARASVEQIRRHKNVVRETLDEELQLAIQAGDRELVSTILDKQGRMNLRTPEGIRVVKDAAMETMETTAYFHALSTSDVDAIRMIKDHLNTSESEYRKTGGTLEPNERASWINRLDNKLDSITAKKATISMDGFKERLRERSAGYGPPMSRSEAAFIPDPQKRALAEKSIDMANAKGDAIVRTSTSSYAEDMKSLADIEARMQQPGGFDVEDAERDGTVAALKAKQQALNNDSVGYILQNDPELRRQFDELQEVEDPAQRSVMLDEYFSGVKAEAKRYGVPDEDIVYLAQNEVKAIKATLSGKGSQARAAIYASLGQKYGEHFEEVSRQLVDEDVLNGMDKRIVSVSDDLGISQDLMIAADTPMKDLKAMNAARSPDVTDADWDNMVAAASLEYITTLSGEGRESAQIQYDTRQLARSYHARGIASDPQDAVDLAATEIINKRFSFQAQDNTDRPLRVPAAYSEYETAPHLRRLQNVEGLTIDLRNTGYPVDIEQSELQKILQDQGYWQASGDGKRVMLMWPDMSPVLQTQPNGTVSRVEYDWDFIINVTPETETGLWDRVQPADYMLLNQ